MSSLPSYPRDAPEDQAFVRDPRFEYNVFDKIVQKAYPTAALAGAALGYGIGNSLGYGGLGAGLGGLLGYFGS